MDTILRPIQTLLIYLLLIFGLHKIVDLKRAFGHLLKVWIDALTNSLGKSSI